MANKRTLKRAIRMICEELFVEAVAVSMYGTEAEKANANAILFSIVRLQNDYVSRISHPEPGMKPKDYYKDLREKFSKQVAEFIDQLNA